MTFPGSAATFFVIGFDFSRLNGVAALVGLAATFPESAGLFLASTFFGSEATFLSSASTFLSSVQTFWLGSDFSRPNTEFL